MAHALVEALRLRRVDVTTALDAGMIQRDDEEHLKYAAQQGRALYSFNVRHFYKLHTDYLSEGKSHAGIILAPQQRYSVGEQMRALLKLSAARSAEDMQNQVEFLSLWT
jgi:hypothetical protein